MLSRTVILGRCPAELMDLLGYNPVVEVDWNDPCGRVMEILGNIGDYQKLVDRNRETALEMGPWSSRIPQILSEIQSLNEDDE